MRYNFCEGNHSNGYFQVSSGSQSEEVNYIGNQGHQQFSSNPYPIAYNQGCRQNNTNYGGRQKHGASSSGSY